MARTKEKAIKNTTNDNSDNKTNNGNEDNEVVIIDEDNGDGSDVKVCETGDQSVATNQRKSSSSVSDVSKGDFTGDNHIKVYFLETKPLKSFSQSSQTIGRQPKSMQMAFSSMKSHRFDANWIKEDDVIDNQLAIGSDNCIFILESFEGKTYEFLVTKKCRIVGPLSVLYCYSSSAHNRFKNIPEIAVPVFSQCMRKLFVSITGFDGQRKVDLISKIEKMCGNFSKDFTKRVTHLVSDSVRTKKYSVAKSTNTPVVSSDWIDDCWTEHQHNLLYAGDPTVVDKYCLKIFNKLMITVSQLGVEERTKVMEMVNKNGGEYSPSLKLTASNAMLLLKEPSGDKFKYAQIRGIPCLDIKWIYDSVEKGYALPEEQYVMRNTVSQKVQTSQRLEINENPIKTTQTLDKLGMSVISNLSDNSSVSANNGYQEIVKKIQSLVKNGSHETFLEGCDVYVVGFSRPVFDSIKSGLISSGSVVYNEFKDLVSHVIVGPLTSEAEKDQLFANKSLKLVTIDWFLESLAQRECCDCTQYEVKYPKTPNITAETPSTTKLKKRAIFDGPLTVVPSKKRLQRSVEESNLDTKFSHKSLGDRMNDKNDILWDDGSDDEMQIQ